LRDSLPMDMLLSAVSFLVVAQSSSEVPEGLMNNPVYWRVGGLQTFCLCVYLFYFMTSQQGILYNVCYY